MKKSALHIILFFNTLIIISCTKTVSSTGTGNGSGTTTGKTYLNVTQISNGSNTNIIVSPSDGNMFITLGNLYTSGYANIASGSTNIKVQSQLTGKIFHDTTYVLTDNAKSTAFVYPINAIYKVSVVQEDYSSPAAGYAKIRLLDFSKTAPGNTADFSISNGNNSYSFTGRTFLDHELDNTLTNFTTVNAGNYTLYAVSGSSVIINPYNFNLVSGKIYSIVVTSITSTDLLSYTMPHN
ncbi:MAG: DUF4397 domain-containing protein [Bacteroidetes bacterium]|nr:DUF4397 domain-containing protein [Bacteroidota bacterium]MBS1649586.1 DUF4397 domain-containing protein [Bacteroidota bacterium]